MRVQEHISKISWSFADKLIILSYGIITLFQIRAADPLEYGLFFLMNSMNIWIFVVCDSFALQGLIQFGMNENNRKKANSISLIFHLGIAFLFSLIFFVFRSGIASVFDEPRLFDLAVNIPLFAALTAPRIYAVKMLYRDHRLKTVFWVDLVHFGAMTALTVFLLLKNSALFFTDFLVIYIGGTAVSALFSVFVVRKELRFSWKGNLEVKKFLSFSFPMMFAATLHSLPKLLDVFIIQYFFSATFVGVYSSAKTFFRVFDEAANAAYGLIYPSAVRLIDHKDYNGLVALITKASSFILFAFIGAFIILEAGLSEYIIKLFLPDTYSGAVGLFNLLLLGALAYPFVIMSLAIHAEGKPQIALKIVLVSLVFSFLVFYIIGETGSSALTPLGLVIYYFSFGLLSAGYLKKKYKFGVSLLFRAPGDSWNYFKSIIEKPKLK